MDDLKHNEPIVRMRTVISNWLSSDDWNTAQLVDWFQGYDLPALGHEEESYLWLLRGIPEAAERHPTERKLAERVAVLLREEPDVNRPGRWPDQVLYNLFMFCAGLSSADELADPLFEVLKRRRLHGKWRGVDLRTPLKAALIANQADSRLWQVWEEAVHNKADDFLRIDETEFFEAARLLRGSERGSPAIGAIGEALLVMSKKLEVDREKRKRYRTCIDRVIDTYPGRPSWNSDLLYQADRDRWPVWAVECLPSLFIRTTNNVSPNRTLIWHYLASCIPSAMEYAVVRKVCNDQVFEVRMSDEASKFVESIAPIFELNRLRNPYPSDRSILGIVIASMIETGIDPTAAPIKEKLKCIGYFKREELDDVIEPIADRVNEGEITKDNVVQFARTSMFPDPTVTYVEQRIAA